MVLGNAICQVNYGAKYSFHDSQVKLSVSGKDFKLTLIARRSRHFAGTRYFFIR